MDEWTDGWEWVLTALIKRAIKIQSNTKVFILSGFFWNLLRINCQTGHFMISDLFFKVRGRRFCLKNHTCKLSAAFSLCVAPFSRHLCPID